VGELVIGAKGKVLCQNGRCKRRPFDRDIYRSSKTQGYLRCRSSSELCHFNDGIHDEILDKEVRDDRTIVLRHGEPMIFGKEKNKGLLLDGLRLKVVTIGENGITADKLLIHDAQESNPGIQYMLANMKYPEYPVALGVIRQYHHLPTTRRLHSR
jgi:2-oxoglutarate/2-oxoacid ferredoxin oxidoreductase subunit beta